MLVDLPHAASFRRLAALACGVAALAAAAPGPAAASAPVAAGDPASFRYEALPAEGSVDFVIDQRSPTFEFQSGPSAYRAFRLPDLSHAYYVELRAFLDGPPDPERARVFYPVMALLTDDFLVSRQTELDFLRFDLPVFEQAAAPAYRVTVGVDPARARERYLIVFTPASLMSERTLPPISTPDSAADAARVAFLGAARYGRLRITLRSGEVPGSSPAVPDDTH